jgi:hypothetical protein
VGGRRPQAQTKRSRDVGDMHPKADENGVNLQAVAFYTDTEHKVEPVTKGIRIVLQFDVEVGKDNADSPWVTLSEHSSFPMEDTAMMSTSVSTVRTLHFATPERVSQRADRLSTTSTTDSAASSPMPHNTPRILMRRRQHLVLPSPPGSPNLSPVHSAQHSPSFDSLSESSLPSVSSSFFFSSSAAGSPGRSRNGSYPHSEQEQDRDHPIPYKPPPLGHTFVIPSLALPPALRQPTPFGQTLGVLASTSSWGTGRWKELPDRLVAGR